VGLDGISKGLDGALLILLNPNTVGVFGVLTPIETDNIQFGSAYKKSSQVTMKIVMTYRSRRGVWAEKSKACTAVSNDTDDDIAEFCVDGYGAIDDGRTFDIRTKCQGNLFHD
jgi:hypothetical protein